MKKSLLISTAPDREFKLCARAGHERAGAGTRTGGATIRPGEKAAPPAAIQKDCSRQQPARPNRKPRRAMPRHPAVHGAQQDMKKPETTARAVAKRPLQAQVPSHATQRRPRFKGRQTNKPKYRSNHRQGAASTSASLTGETAHENLCLDQAAARRSGDKRQLLGRYRHGDPAGHPPLAAAATVVEIYPVWRGYEFIMVGNEILVIDPATLRIVAILDAWTSGCHKTVRERAAEKAAFFLDSFLEPKAADNRYPGT